MRKRFLAVLLTLAMVLALAVPAFAAPDAPRTTFYEGWGGVTAEIEADAIVAEEWGGRIYIGEESFNDSCRVYTVKTGYTLTVSVDYAPGVPAMYGAKKISDEDYEYSYERTVGFTTNDEHVWEVKLDPEHVGTWAVYGGEFILFILNVVEGDSSAPSTPAEPEQPAVPAWAEKLNVTFSADPIGTAAIKSEYYDLKDVYVFDQDVTVALKDGRSFTVVYNYEDISLPSGMGDYAGPLVAPTLNQVSKGIIHFFIQGEEDTSRSPYMVTKAYLDKLAADGFAVTLTPLGESAAQPAAGTYTAKQWDTWGQLALNNYGTLEVWPALMKANGGKAVSVGMTVTLPEKIGSYSLLAPQVLAEGETLYTVKAGDTLGQIALATYGDMSLYKAIYERNKDRLKSPTMIYESQTLVLPVKPAAQVPAEQTPAQPEQPAEQQPVSFAKGDKVTVRADAKTYTGGSLAGFVYRNTYTVISVKGDRVVIGVNGVVTAAMNAADLAPAK